MKKMLAEHKWKLLFSSAVILLLQLAGLLLEEKFLYYLPLWMLAMHWLCLLITFADWRKRPPQGKKVVNLIFWIVPAMSLTVSAVMLLAKSGQVNELLLPAGAYLFIGLLLLVIGNYLPKIRQNRTMGIKVKWVLEDEANWNATHRFGGKVWVVCGFACMFCSLLPFGAVPAGICVAAVVAAAVLPTIYSWRYYRRRLQAGEVAESHVSRRAVFVTGILTAATVGFVVWVLLAGDMEVSYQEDGFTVEASGWQDYEAKYADIEAIAYEPDCLADGQGGMRVYGFGGVKMSMGDFHNERYGDYIRYTFNGCPACVVLQVKGETVVLNGQDEAATEEIYRTLQEKCGQ